MHDTPGAGRRLDPARFAPRGPDEFHAGDGTVYYGDDARREGDAHFAKSAREHRAAVNRLTPIARRAYAQYKRTGFLPPAPRRVRARCGGGRPAAKPATSPRRGGDSGDSDPDEPWRRRFAALTFERFARLTAPLPPHWRAALHAHLPEPIQAQAWQTLREQTERERDNPPADIVARRRAHSEYRRAA